MKKNRLKLFKNKPKRPKKVPNWETKIFQLENNIFATKFCQFSNCISHR